MCANCWRRESKIPLLFSHADDPKETQWFGSVQQLAEEHGLKVVTPDSPNTPRVDCAGRAAETRFCVFLLLPLHAGQGLA